MSTESSKKNMNYVRLGTSGLKVSRIILGCASYGSPEWQGWTLGEEEGLEHIKAAYDAGINAFDTANIYSSGLSEVVLGKAIKKHDLPRDEIVVLTNAPKLHGAVFKTQVSPSGMMAMSSADKDATGYTNQYGLSRKHIFDSVKHSLERLQLDYIDVLQCHRFDYDTPIEETMQALHDVVKAGYVRYIGMSSCHAYQFHIMQNYALTHGLTPFISMQNHYSLAYREEEREMFPTLKYFGVGSIPWSPLAMGFLTRPLEEQKNTKRGGNDPLVGMYGANESNKEIVRRVEKVAKEKNVSMAQVALAWMMNKPGVSAPIVGTTSLANLMDLLAAVNVNLSEEDMKTLEEPYQPSNVLGHF